MPWSKPLGSDELRMRETGGQCPIHKAPLFEVYDVKGDAYSDAYILFNDLGEKPTSLCWLCSAVMREAKFEANQSQVVP